MAAAMHDRILQGASTLCFSLGFSHVRVEEIARYLGISKKTIYNHFPSKEDLFQRVVEANIAAILEGLDERARAVDRSLTEKLRTILNFLVEELTLRQAVLFASDRTKNRVFRDRMVRIIRRKVVDLTARLFAEGKATGAVREDVNPELLPYVYMGLIEGTFQLCEDIHPPYPPQQLILEALRLSLVGVLSREEAEALSREA